MGNYNSQYESYYSKLGVKTYNGYSSNYSNRYSPGRNGKSSTNGGYFAKRFMQELTGVLFLFLAVIICKIVATPETAAVYSYSKQMVNENFDYTSYIGKLKDIKYSEIQAYAENLIESMKTNKGIGLQNSN